MGDRMARRWRRSCRFLLGQVERCEFGAGNEGVVQNGVSTGEPQRAADRAEFDADEIPSTPMPHRWPGEGYSSRTLDGAIPGELQLAATLPRIPVVRFARPPGSAVLPDTLTAVLQGSGRRVKMIGLRHPYRVRYRVFPLCLRPHKRAVIGSCCGGKVGRWKKGCATERSGYPA